MPGAPEASGSFPEAFLEAFPQKQKNLKRSKVDMTGAPEAPGSSRKVPRNFPEVFPKISNFGF